METTNPPKMIDPLLVSNIVSNYVAHNQLPPSELPSLIATVHQALDQLGKPVEPERTPAVPIPHSVSRNAVTCLECGWRGQMLRRHIASHDLTIDGYRTRWSLRSDHPLIAPNYSARRSELARQTGLGRANRRDATVAGRNAAESAPKAAAAAAASSRQRKRAK